MEIYKWKWMVLGALRCKNNADFQQQQKIDDSIVLVVLII